MYVPLKKNNNRQQSNQQTFSFSLEWKFNEYDWPGGQSEKIFIKNLSRIERQYVNNYTLPKRL